MKVLKKVKSVPFLFNLVTLPERKCEQVDVIPFVNTWPYERLFNDIYVQTCPFCGEENVLTNMKKLDFKRAQEGIKTHLIMPCCNGKMIILEADEDYFWTDRKLRKD